MHEVLVLGVVGPEAGGGGGGGVVEKEPVHVDSAHEAPRVVNIL